MAPLNHSGEIITVLVSLFLPAAKPRRSMGHVCPPPEILEIVAIRGQKSMVTCVIEVTELNFEVRCDLRGRLEAAMASEQLEAICTWIPG